MPGVIAKRVTLPDSANRCALAPPPSSNTGGNYFPSIEIDAKVTSWQSVGMATSVRLPPDLHAEALRSAGVLGISFNALVAVALRDYLTARAGVLMAKASSAPPRGGNRPKVTAAARAAHKRRRR